MTRDSRRQFVKGAGAIGIAGLSGCLGDNSGDQETHELSYHTIGPENHYISESVQPWLERVREESDGRIEFEEFYGMPLADPPEFLDIVQERTVDIAWVGSAYQTDVTPLSDVFSLPGTFELNQMREAFELAHDIMEDILIPHEYDDLGVRPLSIDLQPPYNVCTMDTKIEEDGDWGGLNLRTAGGIMSQTAEMLGATPVEMAGIEAYEALDRGTLDGSIITYLDAYQNDYHELVNHGATNLHLASFAGITCINEDTLSELPDDLEELLIKSARDTFINDVSQFFEEREQDNIEAMDEAGVDMYEVASGTADKWNNRVRENAEEAWLDLTDHEMANEVVDEWLSSW